MHHLGAVLEPGAQALQRFELLVLVGVDGAHVVLGESLGSISSAIHAGPGRYAVGIEINATHSRSVTEGLVTGTCRALVLGRTLCTHEIVMTDEQGQYEYETIKPAAYNVGSEKRPSHIHYMAQATGHQRLITQIYFKGDKHIAQDPWASKSPLIINLQKEKCAKGTYLAGRFDLVLAPAGA